MPELLALEWQTDRWRGVAVRTAAAPAGVAADVTLLGAFDEPCAVELGEVRDVEQTAAALKRALAGLATKPQRTLIVLPREALVVRKLELPDLPESELPDLVRLQAATKLATPVERLAIDFLPQPRTSDTPGASVLMMTVEAERLHRIAAALRSAGLDPVGCLTSATTLAEVAGRLRTDRSDPPHAPTLIVYQHATRLEILVLVGRQVVFTHATHLPPAGAGLSDHVQPLMSELSRTLIALRQTHHDAEIAAVLVIQDGPPDAEVLRVLEERFADRVHRIDAGEAVSAGELRGAAEQLSAPAIGAILAETAATLPGIDFLRPRKTAVRRDPRRFQKLAAVAAAVLLLLVGGWTYFNALADKDRQIADLERSKAELNELVESDGSKATLTSAQAVEEWLRGAADPSQTLAELQVLLPGTHRVYFQSLKFNPNPELFHSETRVTQVRIRGTGLARDRADIVQLEQRLADAGYRVVAKPPESNRRDPDYPWKFELDVSVPRPPHKPANTAVADADRG